MSEWQAVGDILKGKHTGDTVKLRGWVHRQRSGGKIAFVTLRDGTGVVQCTVKAGIADDESLDAAKAALIESSVSLLEGEVVADERAPGGFEVKVARFELHQRAEDFPLRGEQGTDVELDKRHLWLRSTELSAVLRIKHRLLLAIRDFFDAETFVEVDPSLITTNACEGGTTLFEFDYFGQTAYLSQSAQMYLEGCIFGLPKVYSITNSFRAEKSRTNKHLTEFHHLEAEYAWWDHDENLAFQERLVEYLAHDIAEKCVDDLAILGQDPARLKAIKAPFDRLSYDDAVQKLQNLGFEFPHGEDFGAPHEHALTEGLTNPIFVEDWPADIKAFYMHQDPENPSKVKCADLLAPDGFGEIIGGSQRSEDIEWMKARLWSQFTLETMDQISNQEVDQKTRSWAEYFLGIHDPIKEYVHADIGVVNKAMTWIAKAAFGTGARAQIGMPDDMGKYAGSVQGGDEVGGKTASLTIIKSTDSPGDIFWLRRIDGALKSTEIMEAFIGEVRDRALRPYEWYFDLRRYGSVPHSGFGLGVERLLKWFTGQEHIRDMLPYPRTPNRAYP